MTTEEIIHILRDAEFGPVYVVVEGERFDIESMDTYDNEVHLTVGEPAEE
jgi:hypothetical protein